MSQCVSGFSSHCMVSSESGVPGGEQSVCCDGTGTGQHFSDVYRFVPTDTARHQCCFLSVWNVTDNPCEEERTQHGRYCGYGCLMCDDLRLNEMTDYLDGERWLRAEQRAQQRYWDARGQIHDLRSNEYHPIPGDIMYERGSCWANGGRECFQEDSCTCFGANTPEYPGQASSTPFDIVTGFNCEFGHYPGDPIDGRLFPDPFFRTGYRWPPGIMAGMGGLNRQIMERLYCRKFQDARYPFDAGGGHDFTRVVISPTKSGGLSGVTEPVFDPVLMSSKTCNSDRMVPCTARMGTNSECYGTSAWGEYVESYPGHDPDPALAFYTASSSVRNRFNYLLIDGENTAEIRGASDREGLGGPTVEWKNRVLNAIKTESFPYLDSSGTRRTLDFNSLDHMHPLQSSGNLFVGIYRREWHGGSVPIPNGSGRGRLRMTGCEFDYEANLTHVKIEARVILPQVKEWFVSGDPTSGLYYIEPLVRFHIIGVVSMFVSNLRSAPFDPGRDQPPTTGPCSFFPAAGPDQGHPVYLSVYHTHWSVGGVFPELWASYVRPPKGRVPDIDPPVGEPWDQPESFMFFDDEGKQFIPDHLVEWRGMLGGHSVPSAEDQRIMLTRGGGGCELVADRFNEHPSRGDYSVGITVPGWPTHADSHPGDPQQIYGGHVRLEFP